jgi:drug/metabolite transporter, DME family
MNKPTAYLLVSSAIVFWGLGSVFTKNILEAGVGSLEIAFWRLLFSGVLFILHALAQRDLKLKAAKDLWSFVGFAVFIIALNYLGFNYAIQHGGVSLVNLLLALVPLLIALFAWLFLRERLTLRLLGLLALSVVGLLFASWGGGHGIHISFASLGFSFLTVITTAAFTLFSKGLLRHYSSVSMNAFIMPLAALALLPFVSLRPLPVHVWFDLLLLVLLPSYLAYLLYQAGLQRLETTQVALLTNLEPATGLLFAAVFFGERFSTPGTLGVVLVLAVSVLAVLSLTRQPWRTVQVLLRPSWRTLDKVDFTTVESP